MLDLIASKKKEIQLLCEKYEIKTMYVFGSACTGHFDESSDVDILISFKNIPFDRYTDNYFELHYQLEELLGRKVDLITENSLSNPFFIESIEETKQLLYAA